MSAFDEARRGAARPGPRGGASRQGGGGGFGGAFDAAASAPRSSGAAAGAGSYQNADRLYTSTCDNVEKEMRKLTTYVTTLKKQVDQIGTARDSQDLRIKIKSGIQKGNETMKSLGTMLKVELAPAVDSAELSAREKTARKQQMQRYMSDYKAGGDAFEEVMRSAQAAERKHPNAPKGEEGAGAAGGRRGGRFKGGQDDEASREEERLLSRMQAVDFDASLVEEREANIINIASTIQEVNETMKDLAALVEEQGKDIAVIEDNVTEAESRTASGVKELESASKYQKGYRKWIFVFILLILAIAGGATAYVVITQKKGN